MTQKTAAGLLGIAAVGCGGIAIANPEWVGVVYEPPWKPLSQDSNYESGGYGSKFGENHKNYLVGTSSENKTWWDEKVKSIKENEKNGKFKKIKQGFDGENSLKELCNEAYKKVGTDLKTNEEPKENEFKKSDVWKYCSVLGKGPSVVKAYDRAKDPKKYENDSSGKTLIGKAEEDSLISVNDKQNKKFWDLRNQEFYETELFANGKGITVDPGHKFFTAAKNKNQKTIKEICAEAYSMDSSGTSSESTPSKEETKKYCSLRMGSN